MKSPILRKSLALGLWMFSAAATAMAQVPPPQVETITSEGRRQKDDATARHFVEGVLAQSPSLDGQYAKWKIPVCPHVYGLTPIAAYVIEHRITEIAEQIGAPVNRNDPCTPNIGIIFSTDPQKTLDSIAKKAPYLVLTSSRHLKVQHPVDTWYAGIIRDYNGGTRFDQAWEDSAAEGPQWVPANISRIFTGQDAEMGAATVLVDSQAVTGMTLGSIADYVALQTLAQAQLTGKCQPAPSIINLMVTGCDDENRTTSLSDVDLAMLTALYSTPESPEMLQRQRIVGAMRRYLDSPPGP